MGVNPKSADYFFNILKAAEMRDFSKVSVCILGNQNMRSPSHTIPEYNHKTFRRVLVSHGFGRVESVDINGRDESLVMDLSKPISRELVGKFDVVLDYGTLEHILYNQWQVFKNMHDFLKTCGVIIHGFLPPERSRGHGFWIYDKEFLCWIAKSCSYKIVDIQVGMTDYFRFSNRTTLFFTMQKEIKSKFMDKRRWRDPVKDELGQDNFRRVIGTDYDTFMRKYLNEG